jgi:hypothetical protein
MRKPRGSYSETGAAKAALRMGQRGMKTFPKMGSVFAKKGTGKGLTKKLRGY